jgi:excisionase family DNA binding protein
MAQNNRLVSQAEAAKRLGISRMTVNRWVKSGRLISIKQAGRLFVAESEIERLSPQTTPPPAVSASEVVKRVIKEYGEVLKKLSRE